MALSELASESAFLCHAAPLHGGGDVWPEGFRP